MNPEHDDQSYLDELELHPEPDKAQTREPEVILNRISPAHVCHPDVDGICYSCRFECGR